MIIIGYDPNSTCTSFTTHLVTVLIKRVLITYRNNPHESVSRIIVHSINGIQCFPFAVIMWISVHCLGPIGLILKAPCYASYWK